VKPRHRREGCPGCNCNQKQAAELGLPLASEVVPTSPALGEPTEAMHRLPWGHTQIGEVKQPAHANIP